MKVLIADSEELEQQHLTQLLDQLGHNTLIAKDGYDALQLFRDESPDLVMIDLELPGLDALTTVQQLRKACFDISEWKPILFLSHSADDDTITQAIDAGGDDFLKKPITLGLLKAKIKAMRRLISMRQNLIDFGQQMRVINDRLLDSTQLLNELSLKDPLTLIANRRAFEDGLERAILSAIRHGEPLSLIMIDIDDFKKYNDNLGHQQGDQCLQQVAQFLSTGLHRPKDFIARYGGEEFAIILPETEIEGANYVAERIRRSLHEHGLHHPESAHNGVTASFGVASVNPMKGFQGESLVKASDLALYKAKELGRNCVVFCHTPVERLDLSQEQPWQQFGT
jgi:diguanylate cyclase (GGDEF)-like protein